MDKNEFEQDHKIDPLQLDVEAARQPELFFKWCERAVEARGKVDRFKLKLETTEAMLSLQCRKNPGKFNLEKTTENSISASVKLDPRYVIAAENYFQAREASALLDRAVGAMEMKKRMLEVLITLHGQQYFAGPSTPRNLSEVWKSQQERAKKRVLTKQRVKLRKRRK